MADRDFRSSEPWEIAYKRKTNAKKHGSQKKIPLRKGKVSHRGAVFVKRHFQHRHGHTIVVRSYRRRKAR